MCKINIKTIRNEYENLSLLVEKENNTASEKDLTTKARTISNEDMQQIFSEQHGGVVDTITKSTDNAVFAIILDSIKSELVLSPFIGIKDTNGTIVIIWNIEDETMTLLPLLKWVTECPLIKVSWQKILYEKILIKIYPLHTMGIRDKPQIDTCAIPTQWDSWIVGR